MANTLLALVILTFVGMLAINVYFRLKVIKIYRKLRKNKVQLELKPAHLFDTEKLESEIIPQHPNHADDIRTFVNNIRFSVRMASVLSGLITLFAAILMYPYFFGEWILLLGLFDAYYLFMLL